MKSVNRGISPQFPLSVGLPSTNTTEGVDTLAENTPFKIIFPYLLLDTNATNSLI